MCTGKENENIFIYQILRIGPLCDAKEVVNQERRGTNEHNLAATIAFTVHGKASSLNYYQLFNLIFFLFILRFLLCQDKEGD
jgi:hypothetical protein